MSDRSALELMHEFSKQEGCNEYVKDGKKVKLLLNYLWVRIFAPALTFETFLSCFGAVADYSLENLKHPEDIVNVHLPRSKAKAAEYGKEQWGAKDVAHYLSAYIDILRKANVTGEPVPLDLLEFVQSEEYISAYKSGNLVNPVMSQKASKKGKRKEPETRTPTHIDQRAIYSLASGKQYRGHIVSLYTAEVDGESHQYAKFMSDSGILFNGIGIATLSVCDDPDSDMYLNSDGSRMESEEHTINIANDKSNIDPLFILESGVVPTEDKLSDNTGIWSTQARFSDGYSVSISLDDSESGVWVDAYLMDKSGKIIYEVEPRNKLLGKYYCRDKARNKVYVVTVVDE